MGNLLDVMDQGEQLPLGVDFIFATEGEPAHAFVLEIREHRLDDGDALVIDVASHDGVEFAFHLFDWLFFSGFGDVEEDGDLFGDGLVRGAQATMALRARAADGFGAPELHPEIAVDVDVVAVAIKMVSGGTAAGAVHPVIVEVFRRVALGILPGAPAALHCARVVSIIGASRCASWPSPWASAVATIGCFASTTAMPL